MKVAYKIIKVTLCVPEITVSPRRKIDVIVIVGEPFLTHSVMPIPCSVSVSHTYKVGDVPDVGKVISTLKPITLRDVSHASAQESQISVLAPVTTEKLSVHKLELMAPTTLSS